MTPAYVEVGVREWLAFTLGPAVAYDVGVHPFWIGAVVKSLLAAFVCVAVARKRISDPVRGSFW